MFDALARRVLSLLKVPSEPHAPAGAPASLRVFRAGRNYYRLRLATWAFGQTVALVGIVFWTAMLLEVEHLAAAERVAEAKTAAAVIGPSGGGGQKDAASAAPESGGRRFQRWRESVQRKLEVAAQRKPGERRDAVRGGWAAFKRLCVEVAVVMPPWVFSLAWVLKIVGFAVYLVQFGVTYAVRRLDYEMRWYLVTDRSLRLRYGVWSVAESTMSFANLQQVVVSQGPLQGLLGLADVKVQSAGGGGHSTHRPDQDDMHVGYFHNVTNAHEIRDLILERLKRFKESGLGDPEERGAHAVAPDTVKAVPPAPSADPLLAAAQALAAEARALRGAVR